MTSGIRKEPPISTSSPRETGTSLSRASALRLNKTAAALLFTTVAASAPAIANINASIWASLLPRLPAAAAMISSLLGRLDSLPSITYFLISAMVDLKQWVTSLCPYTYTWINSLDSFSRLSTEGREESKFIPFSY